MLGGRRPTVEDIRALPWTTACFQEAMRFYPPAWAIPRTVRRRGRDRRPPDPQGRDGDHPGPRHPPRRALLAGPRGVRPDPLPRPRTRKGRHRSAYLPFGGGRRICIGSSFALMETTLITAMMSQQFVYDLVPGHPVEPEATLTLRPRNGREDGRPPARAGADGGGGMSRSSSTARASSSPAPAAASARRRPLRFARSGRRGDRASTSTARPRRPPPSAAPTAAAYVCDVADADAVTDLAARSKPSTAPSTSWSTTPASASPGRSSTPASRTGSGCASINLDGVVHGCHAFGPGMVERGHGHVVNVASGAGYIPNRHMAAYCASKAAVIIALAVPARRLARRRRRRQRRLPRRHQHADRGATRATSGRSRRRKARAERALRPAATRRTSSPRRSSSCVERNRDVVPVGFESTLAYKLLRGAPAARSKDWSPDPVSGAVTEHHRVVIIGAGYRRRRPRRPAAAGRRSTTSSSASATTSVGGTWFEHTYPGCGCDIPTHLYSYSFARNPNWTRLFPKQARDPRVRARDIADEHGVIAAHPLRLRDGALALGRGRAASGGCETSEGELTCDVLVSARSAPPPSPTSPTSPASRTSRATASTPRAGTTTTTSTGERVAVIGTGPAAAQFVPRDPAARSSRLTVFQRTPPWVIPHPDRPVPGVERAALPRRCRAPRTSSATLFFALYEAMRRRLPRPHRADRADRGARPRAPAPPGPRPASCARSSRRATASAASARSSPTPTTRRSPPTTPRSSPTPIARGRRRARSSPRDGARHEVDTIITAIGYRYSRSLLVDRVVGVGGRTLGDVWDRSPRAYLGTTVPGFPNMFILLGPNSIGINSVIFSLESQIAYVMGALRTMERDGVGRIEVRPRRSTSFVDDVDRRSDGSVWTDGGCTAYYIDDTGRNFAIYPGLRRRVPPPHAALRPGALRRPHRRITVAVAMDPRRGTGCRPRPRRAH